ncbi:MAG: hypothetical protein IPM80_23955 [Proteobacteria bacterium]|nr:hypothetical protein [Pseudomonadota bacterium]
MTTSTARRISIGNRNDNPAEWTDFAWDDPLHGAQTKDVVAVIRQQGSSGSLMAGLWRTGYEVAGCEKDGSCRVQYSAPLGDETMVLAAYASPKPPPASSIMSAPAASSAIPRAWTC